MKQEANIPRIAVVGSGYMGGGMAQVFILNGYSCIIADATSEIALASFDRLVREAREFEVDGLFPHGSAELIKERLECGDSIEDAVSDADYIAEAVPERADIKSAVLSRISSAARPDALITSNTSAMPIEVLSGYVTYPERFLGVHWMNPAPFVPCVEVIPSSQTALPAIEFSEKLIQGLGKVAVRVSDQAGFVANRLQYALFHEATRMVEEGLATPRQIDQVVSNSFGFRLPFFGPFATADMAGLDIYIGSYESLAAAYGERFAAPQLLTERIANGDLGLKTGGGFTGMDRERIEEIVRYRNRAYVLLQKLREELGPAPGWASEIEQR
jgi:3-hydroxybutyryl-CoA dehydrogenase